MGNDRKMIVKVVKRDTARGKLVMRKCPVWSGILGEEVYIDLLTANKKESFVHFKGVVQTGTRKGANLTISTAILDLTTEQYRQIESLVGGETTAAATA